MDYKKSFILLWLGLIGGVITAFLFPPVGVAIAALAVVQSFVFYRCPECKRYLGNTAGIPSCCPGCGKDLF